MLIALGLLVYFELVVVWHCIVVAILQGLFHSVVPPSIKSLVYDIVGSSRLLNALATLHGASDIARLVGSIMVGFIIAFSGTAIAYFVIAGFLAASLVPLLFIRLDRSSSFQGTSKLMLLPYQ